MPWAGDSSPLDDLHPESADNDERELPGQRLTPSSRRRIYAVLCLAISASGRRTPGRQRVLAIYRQRLGISPGDADLAESMAGHMKSLRIGRRQPEQDAVMAALVELVTADGREPTARERQLLERIGKRASWSPRRIEAQIERQLAPVQELSEDDFDDSGTGVLPEPADDPFGASLTTQRALPQREDASDPFGASLQAPALREQPEPFGGAADPFASAVDPFASAADPFASAADPFADDPLAAEDDPFGASLTTQRALPQREDASDPFGASLQAPALSSRPRVDPPLGLMSQHDLNGYAPGSSQPELSGVDTSGLDRALGEDLDGLEDGGFVLDDDDDSDTGVIPDARRDALRLLPEEELPFRS